MIEKIVAFIVIVVIIAFVVTGMGLPFYTLIQEDGIRNEMQTQFPKGTMVTVADGTYPYIIVDYTVHYYINSGTTKKVLLADSKYPELTLEVDPKFCKKVENR